MRLERNIGQQANKPAGNLLFSCQLSRLRWHSLKSCPVYFWSHHLCCYLNLYALAQLAVNVSHCLFVCYFHPKSQPVSLLSFRMLIWSDSNFVAIVEGSNRASTIWRAEMKLTCANQKPDWFSWVGQVRSWITLHFATLLALLLSDRRRLRMEMGMGKRDFFNKSFGLQGKSFVWEERAQGKEQISDESARKFYR